MLARNVMATMETYTEISPSGRGIKLFCIAESDTLPAQHRTKNKAGTVEIYTRQRFFAVTGHRLAGNLEMRGDQLLEVWRAHIDGEQQDQQVQACVRTSDGGTISQVVLRHMLRIKPQSSGEVDGSRRLITVCCRAIESGLSDASAVTTIREYERILPFPRKYSDDEIVDRLRDAERMTSRDSAIKSYRTTDADNARRFADQHGEDVRFCHVWNKWLVWDGRRWAVDTTGEIMRKAKSTSQAIYIEAAKATDKNSEALGKWAAVSQNRARLTAMIQLAQSEPPIPIETESLDSQAWLFNCQNGTLDLRTGSLRNHCREDYLTKLCCVVYPKRTATEPTLWMRFLRRILDGNGQLIRFVQQLLGMSLVGNVYEHILPIFYGTGSNGKSTLLETWCNLLGRDYAMKAPHGFLMTSRSDKHPTELADLHGKRFVAVAETEYGKCLSESLVKELTGGDTIRARRMKEDFWEFQPSHTIVLATNHKPLVRGTDYAIWRRLRLVPFTVTISDDETDKELKTKLRSEWPAILAWAVRGCLDWQQNGLLAPYEVGSATQAYQDESDVLGTFIEECCVLQTGARIKASELFAAYTAWAKGGYQFIENQTRFGSLLSDRKINKKKSNGVIVYLGIRLRSESAFPCDSQGVNPF